MKRNKNALAAEIAKKVVNELKRLDPQKYALAHAYLKQINKTRKSKTINNQYPLKKLQRHNK